ncbi:uncharacterized protein LOC141737443 [Larus michahellis]|uniref:uncharacterized protein LOC141737443 n=1 Tax=Larus michahellis TaxID=119627 RepID=UPI003D9B2E30
MLEETEYYKAPYSCSRLDTRLRATVIAGSSSRLCVPQFPLSVCGGLTPRTPEYPPAPRRALSRQDRKARPESATRGWGRGVGAWLRPPLTAGGVATAGSARRRFSGSGARRRFSGSGARRRLRVLRLVTCSCKNVNKNLLHRGFCLSLFHSDRNLFLTIWGLVREPKSSSWESLLPKDGKTCPVDFKGLVDRWQGFREESTKISRPSWTADSVKHRGRRGRCSRHREYDQATPCTDQEIKDFLLKLHPLEFAVHAFRPGDWVLIQSWKETKLQPEWEGPFQVLLTTGTAVRTANRGWTHYTQLKGPVEPLPTDPVGQWTVHSTDSPLRVTLKRQ